MNNPFQSFTIRLNPQSPPAIGVAERSALQAHLDAQDWSAAEQAARHITQGAPHEALGWKALGLSLHRQGRLDEALQPLQQAARLAPNDPDAYNNLGALLSNGEHQQHAEACFQRALQLRADHLPALENLITLLGRLGRHAEQLPLLKHHLSLRPGNEHVRHQVAMLSGEQTDTAPAGYVRQVFDDYADRFDAHLVGELGYQVPRQLSDWLAECMDMREGWRALDLGCGTGLVGEHLRDRTQSLTGVDLSGRMLEKARERACYTELLQSDALAHLRATGNGAHDVVVAADVFIYVGRLDAVVAEAHRVLEPGGRLAFSIESMDAQAPSPDDVARGHRLEPTGRYTHGMAHLAALAARHGFTIERQADVTLRHEKQQPVAGRLHLWRR